MVGRRSFPFGPVLLVLGREHVWYRDPSIKLHLPLPLGGGASQVDGCEDLKSSKCLERTVRHFWLLVAFVFVFLRRGGKNLGFFAHRRRRVSRKRQGSKDVGFIYYSISRWWQLTYFLFSSRILGKSSKLTTVIFFRWVGSTTN